jgi:nitroreductase
MPLDLATVDELLTTTRSVRRRLDLQRPVSREVVLDCLRLALQAPNAGNAQNWAWIVVTDPGKRQALAEIYRRGTEKMYKDLAATAEGQLKRIMDSAVHLVDHLHEVPVHVVPCVVPQTAAVGEEIPPVVLFGSIYPAVWSFQLALRSRGLGSSLIVPQPEAAVADVLDIPDGVVQAGLLPIAHFTGTTFTPALRRPVEEVVHFDGYRPAAFGAEPARPE